MPATNILKVIHARAATMEELFGNKLIKGEIPDEIALDSILKWDKALNSGPSGRINKRLQHFEIMQDSILTKYTEYQKGQNHLDGWISDFNKILGFYRKMRSGYDRMDSNRPKRVYPFEELLIPVLHYVQSTINNGNHEVTGKRLIKDSGILDELSNISQACFFESFRKFKSKQNVGPKGNQIYEAYISYMLKEGITSFFLEFAVLARLMTLTAKKWINSIVNLCKRLNLDRDEINRVFFKIPVTGDPVSFKAAITTGHSPEGMVFILKFRENHHLVYKPRPSLLEEIFNKITKWIEEGIPEVHFKQVSVLSRDNYSWQEYIPYSGCSKENEIRHYYHTAGIWAGLLQMLGSRDYHFGNVRAYGKYPCIIDHETLFSPESVLYNNKGKKSDIQSKPGIGTELEDSIFIIDHTKLKNPNTRNIAGVIDHEYLIRVNKMRNINRDQMELRETIVKWKGSSIPKLNRKLVDPLDYIPEIRKGYGQALDFLAKNKKSWIKTVRDITHNYSEEVRLLLRPTMDYLNIRRTSLEPVYMKEGIERSLLFESLAIKLIDSDSDEECAFILNREKEMLELNLIPWFHCRMDRNHIIGNRKVKNNEVIQFSASRVFIENARLLTQAGYIQKQMKLFDLAMQHLLPR